MSAKFNGKITLSDINPPNSYTLAFDCQGGAAGFGKGKAQVTLLPQDSGCELQYTVSAQIGGKLAQVGQRLVEGAAKSMADDFFKRFEAEMQKRYPAAAAADGAVAPAAAAPPQPAGVPARALWIAGAVTLALAVFWFLRR